MRLTVGLLALTGLIGSDVFAQQKLGQPQGQRTPEKIYATTCGYCHGTNVGPIIRGRALPANLVKHIVRNGQNAMPAFRPTEVTPAELDKLAAWISVSKSDPREKGQ
jgi:mono/diheme cytochrome c family protein